MLRGDDGVGRFFYTGYKDDIPGMVIDAGAGAGPFLTLIQTMHPTLTHVIIIDAGDFQGTPGDVMVLQKEDFLHHQERIRSFPCTLAGEIPYLSMDVHVVLVQVENTSLSYGLSDRVKASLPAIFSLVSSLMEEES